MLVYVEDPDRIEYSFDMPAVPRAGELFELNGVYYIVNLVYWRKNRKIDETYDCSPILELRELLS